MKKFAIWDDVRDEIVCYKIARNGKSALRQFLNGLMCSGIYEIHHDLFTHEWFLSSSYGSYFYAREVE